MHGITITGDNATKVIALAKTLQDKIALVDNKIDKVNVANNLTTTEADFVLDARQGKALQDQLTSLNGSLNNIKKGGWLQSGNAISFNIYDNTSYFLFLNSAGNVYASVLSTLYDFHNTIIKNDFNDNDIEISYDHNTKAVIVKNNGNLIIDCRCI